MCLLLKIEAHFPYSVLHFGEAQDSRAGGFDSSNPIPRRVMTYAAAIWIENPYRFMYFTLPMKDEYCGATLMAPTFCL